MAKMTRTEAFAHFGAQLRNVGWSWSARTADDKTVILALWSDRFSWQARPVRYDDYRSKVDQTWIDRPGNRERLENLVWARDKCDGLFRVVMVTPKDKQSDPREIDESFPRDDIVMKIIDLSEATGEFRAVMQK